MKQINVILVIILVGCTLFQCTKDQMPLNVEFDNTLRQRIRQVSPTDDLAYYILPAEDDYDNIPQDPRNPLTEAKVQLGKFLFYDTGLAQDALQLEGIGTYSCSSCHIPEAGFRSGSFQGIADGGEDFGINGEDRRRNLSYEESQLDVQSARPLSLLNVAFVENTFWNGQFGLQDHNSDITEYFGIGEEELHKINELGFKGIETQNIEGIKTHRIAINKELLDDYGYTPMFDEVFPDVDEDHRYTQETASFALSAYIRSLFANQAPFQDWLKGSSNAMTIEEKKGAILFFGEAQCYQCHYEQNLGSAEFHALGVKDMYQYPGYDTHPDDLRNLGRYGFTHFPQDSFRFKVPQLYNMIDTKFYFHGSSKTTIRDVIEYKLEAQSENPNVRQGLISNKLQQITLTEAELSQLEAFIANGLRDPKLTRYAPASVPSGQCFPNADTRSIYDLGCE